MRKDLFNRMVLFFGLILFIACEKVEQSPGGGGEPQAPDLKRTMQIVINSLQGETSALEGLKAIVSFIDAKGDTVIKNKRIDLKYEQAYFTDSLELQKGNFDLVKFWILKDDKVIFATPRAGSTKASQVSTPLPFQTALVAKEHKLQNLEVARVGENDKAEDFGYAAGDFGKVDPGPVDDPSAVVEIWIHPKITIGDVVYDSIPVSVLVQTYDAAGQMTAAYRSYAPGKNKISVLKSASKHIFKLDKWGTTAELTLTKEQVEAGKLYTLGSSVAAKKLTEVLSYKIFAGVSKPETRILYEYDGQGNVSEVLTYRKRADQTNYLHLREKFNYSGGKVGNVTRFNENGEVQGYADFAYGAGGRLTGIVDVTGSDKTTALFEYLSGVSEPGTELDHTIQARYEYTHHTYTNLSNFGVLGGNIVNKLSTSTTSAYEKGQYQYDFSINPYVHLKIPDLYLSNFSKHNRIGESKEYFKDYPLVEAYQFIYKYNSDGYPTEQVVKYKTYLTGQHAYEIRTVFKY